LDWISWLSSLSISNMAHLHELRPPTNRKRPSLEMKAGASLERPNVEQLVRRGALNHIARQ
jgi:hypothetical protein